MTVDVDRDTASRLGVTAASVDEALYSAFGQRVISTIFTDTNQYRVILEEKPGVVTAPQDLDLVNMQTSTGQPTPLTAVAAVRERDAPLSINRVGQFPAATIGFDTARNVSLGRAVDAIRATEASIHMPTSITTVFLGAANAYQASLQNELWLILAAVVCVYIVLGVLYESYIHPLTILSTLPSAGVGALLALQLTGNDLGVIGDHRHHSVDRHREEERDHDDRLRDRRRARGQDAARGDPRGRAAALPADPDDDVRRAVRRRAADDRARRRLGAAPAAGHRDLRRLDPEPAADALHDARDLSRVRPARERGGKADAQRAERDARRGRTETVDAASRCARGESLRTVRPPARRAPRC